MRSISHYLWTGLAVLFGVLVLAGYVIDLPALHAIRGMLMQWAVVLAAAALLLGLVNMLSVHWNKVGAQEKGWPYSAILLLALLTTFILGLVFGPDSGLLLALFNDIQQPVEASLVALLAVTLTVAGFRVVARRRNLSGLVFAVSALIVLLGTGPWLIGGNSGTFLTFGELRAWWSQVWAAGGARGLLLGVALGATMTGLRILLASDRPYGD
ncbi:MAG TPA: hypothetical protein VFI11_09525 [Anaerolineales bacterium]|nr:hypothetical protein [Anaerolineales bacterium]